MYIKTKPNYKKSSIFNRNKKYKTKKSIITFKFGVLDKTIAILFVILVLLIIAYFNTINFGYDKPSILNVSEFNINISNMLTLHKLSNMNALPFYEVLTYYSIHNSFFKNGDERVSEEQLKELYVDDIYSLQKKYSDKAFDKYKMLIHNIFEDIEVFPISNDYSSIYMYANMYNLKDFYTKNYIDGVYILSRTNNKNEIPIKSMGNGIVKEKGESRKMGEYIVIQTENAEVTYSYLNDSNENISVGDNVFAGDFLGYMGNEASNKATRVYIQYKTIFDDKVISINLFPFLYDMENTASVMSKINEEL